MQWFVLEERGSLLGAEEMGGFVWAGCTPAEQGRSAEVMEAVDNFVESEAGAILAERRNPGCTEGRVGVY
jgi:hypothetical protein